MNNINTRGELDSSALWRIPLEDREVARYLLRDSDVLFNNTNSKALVGKTALYQAVAGDEPVVYSNHLTRYRTNEETLAPEWLAAFLRYHWGRGYFERVATEWVNQASVRDEIVKAMHIPLPPLPEQQGLAVSLQSKFESIERLRIAATRQMKAAEALPHSMLRDVFGAHQPPLEEGAIW
ncbi:restriction endonuclease subunit S [Blastococcus sp. BMG 814]|uniref:Restriction endonuclease subunit S n=1 Tax=Blastococcus carthaginiensis TaxID=3050034 RepID=A0ABT9IHJ6_9ACTN|nr:restriction endonuclease subunit S [Blastococcus carthaginiensis]MDP5185054.1 restriction endonuclease subunit S [Blastococcus carthaginiensis]